MLSLYSHHLRKLIYCEDGNITFLRKVGAHLPSSKESQPTKQTSTQELISHRTGHPCGFSSVCHGSLAKLIDSSRENGNRR